MYCAEVKRNEMKWVEHRAELAVTYHSIGHFHLLLWSGSTKALCFSYPLACSQNFILTYMDTEGNSRLTGTDLCNLGNTFGIVSCCLCVTRGHCLWLMLCCSKHSQPWLVWSPRYMLFTIIWQYDWLVTANYISRKPVGVCWYVTTLVLMWQSSVVTVSCISKVTSAQWMGLVLSGSWNFCQGKWICLHFVRVVYSVVLVPHR